MVAFNSYKPKSYDPPAVSRNTSMPVDEYEAWQRRVSSTSINQPFSFVRKNNVLSPFSTKTDQDPDEPPYSPYIYPSTGPQIAALKAGGEQNAPLVINQYNQKLGDIISANDAEHQLGDEALDNARDYWSKMQSQNMRIGDDKWYLFTQKNQNAQKQFRDAINNQYGSIWQSNNDLANLTDDQFDQENLTAIKLSNFQNDTDYANTANSIASNLFENDQQTYQQIRDTLREGGAALTNYANSILDGLAAYGDKSYKDANGNITSAGWDYLAKFGIVNDGNGGFSFNYNLFSPNLDGSWGSENETMDEYLERMKGSTPQYRTVDYMPMIRSERETRSYVQYQPDRNMDEAIKNGKMSAHDYTDYVLQRYGRS